MREHTERILTLDSGKLDPHRPRRQRLFSVRTVFALKLRSPRTPDEPSNLSDLSLRGRHIAHPDTARHLDSLENSTPCPGHNRFSKHEGSHSLAYGERLTP